MKTDRQSWTGPTITEALDNLDKKMQEIQEALKNVKIYMDEQGYRWSCKHCRGMGWGYSSREQVLQRAYRHWKEKHG